MKLGSLDDESCTVARLFDICHFVMDFKHMTHLQYRLVKLYEALEIHALYVLFIPYVPQAPFLRYGQLGTRKL